MKLDYTCIRCNHKTKKKTDMRRHLYERKDKCPGSANDIELTDEIKEKILLNRVYKIPKPQKNTIKKDKSEISKLTTNEYYNYIYLIRPVECVLNNNNIYKVGMSVVKSANFNITRLSSYKLGSELILVSQCIDANKIENEILIKFNDMFKRAYGNEYFIGNKYEMMDIINQVIRNEDKTINDTIVIDEVSEKIKDTLVESNECPMCA